MSRGKDGDILLAIFGVVPSAMVALAPECLFFFFQIEKAQKFNERAAIHFQNDHGMYVCTYAWLYINCSNMYILGNIHAYIFRIAFGTILCCVNCIVQHVHRPTSSLRCAVSAANAVNVFDFGDGTRVRSCVGVHYFHLSTLTSRLRRLVRLLLAIYGMLRGRIYGHMPMVDQIIS